MMARHRNQLPSHGNDFGLTPNTATASASSSVSSAQAAVSLWDSYPLSHSRSRSNLGPNLRRRASMLSSQVMLAAEGDSTQHLHMADLRDQRSVDDERMMDLKDLMPSTQRPSRTRNSQDFSIPSPAETSKPASPPPIQSNEGPAFNPLNPQGLQVSSSRRQIDTSGELAAVVDPTSAECGQWVSQSPMLIDCVRSADNSILGNAQRAKLSPSHLIAPTSIPLPPPTTPPVQHQRNFGSIDSVAPSTASHDFLLATSTSPGHIVRSGPVKRIVSAKRANLMPKSKAHLRVAMQLQGEGQTTYDVEVASEAALHRLARSAASALSPRGVGPSTSATLANRFPESFEVEDDEQRRFHDVSSESDEDGFNSDIASRGDDEHGGFDDLFDPDALADAEERRRQIHLWSNFRERPLGQSPTTLTSGRGTDSDSFSPIHNYNSNHVSLRGSKRKMAESDRFDCYSSMAFKRRAVSPTASSVHGSSTPILGSPVLGAFSSASTTTPNHLTPLSPNYSGLGFVTRGSGSSRASSPAACPIGQLASSTLQGSPYAGTSLRSGSASCISLGTGNSSDGILTARDDEDFSTRAGESLSDMTLG